MKMDLLVTLLICLLLLWGIYRALIWDSSRIPVRMTLSERIKKEAERQVNISNRYIDKAGRKRFVRANFYRIIILCGYVIFTVVFLLIGKITWEKTVEHLAIVTFIYILTMPQEQIGSVSTPIKKILWKMERTRAFKMNAEISQSASMVKTLALINTDKAFSADYIFEKLSEHGGRLDKHFKYFLTLYRGGRKNEAFLKLQNLLDTSGGRQYVMILEKLEYLNPREMIEQIEVFQQGLMEEILTQRMKEIDSSSILITMAATATVFAIILNFAIVGVFMDSLEMISGIF